LIQNKSFSLLLNFWAKKILKYNQKLFLGLNSHLNLEKAQ
jgi:hypothetical protein